MGLFVDSIYGFTSIYFLCITLSLILSMEHEQIIEHINYIEKKLIIERPRVHND